MWSGVSFNQERRLCLFLNYTGEKGRKGKGKRGKKADTEEPFLNWLGILACSLIDV